MRTTTGRVYTNDMAWCHHVMEVLDIPSFPELIHEWRNQCILKRQQAFYVKITNEEKLQALKGKRIHKQGTAYR